MRSTNKFIGSGVVFAVIAVLLLPWSLRAAEKDAAALFAAGKQAYEKQAYAPALQLLQAAFQADPGHMDTSFYIGLAARSLGRHETAIMAFDRMLIRDPKLPRVRYELSRTYFEMGLYDLAMKIAQDIATDKTLPPEVNKDLDEMLNRIKSSRREHTFAGYLTLAVTDDTNPLSNPQSDFYIPGINIPLSSATPHDWFIGQSLIMDHEYRPTHSNLAWATRGTEYLNWYHRLHDQDLRYFSLKTGPRYYFERARLDLPMVGGSLDKNDENYMQSAGVEPAFIYQLNPNFWLDSSLRVEQRDYRADSDQRYNGTDCRLRLGPVRRWGKNTLSLYGTAERLWAEDSAEAFNRAGLELFAAREIAKWLTLYAGAEYGSSQYQEVNHVESDDRRRDTAYSGKLGAVVLLGEAWTMDLSCRVQENDSNVGLREYNRIVTSLAVTYKF